jgi:hypothetical protein
MTWGTRAEAAAIVGKTPQAVSDQKEKLVRDGMARLNGRRWEYQLDGLREWWQRNVDPRGHSPVGGPPVGRARDRELQALIDAPPPGTVRPVEESRELREHYEAELARLKAEQLAGALVPIADIEALLFGHIRQARDALLGIPAKVVDQLCAVLGNLTAEQRHDVVRMLERELVKVTEDLARLPVKGSGASDAR